VAESHDDSPLVRGGLRLMCGLKFRDDHKNEAIIATTYARRIALQIAASPKGNTTPLAIHVGVRRKGYRRVAEGYANASSKPRHEVPEAHGGERHLIVVDRVAALGRAVQPIATAVQPIATPESKTSVAVTRLCEVRA